jgi:superfamily II DNA or RNA helicase
VLRDYQIQISKEAVAILKAHGMVYLAMQVRTGKTLTSLSTANQYGAKKVLFLTKKKACESIYGDFKKLQPSFDLYVTNYEQLKNVGFEHFDLIILDEAHSLGQFPKPAAKIELLKKICAGKPVIYLSGTPTPESFSQLYHQFYVSSCSPFKEYANFYKWAKDFVKVKVKYIYNRQINDYSSADKTKIDHFTKHLFISYSQEQAGFTQDVKEEVLTVKMQPLTYTIADQLIKRRVVIGQSGSEIVADTEVSMQQKLHQIYSGSVITTEGKALAFDNSKASFIKAHFAEKKIAIFYKFKAELEMLRATFGNQITESPELFNKSTDLVFASQIQSGREGINLSTADALIMFNIDFSAVSYFQARARLQTRDRTKPCLLYWLFADGGLEEKIYKVVTQKKDYTLSYFLKDFLPQQFKRAA